MELMGIGIVIFLILFGILAFYLGDEMENHEMIQEYEDRQKSVFDELFISKYEYEMVKQKWWFKLARFFEGKIGGQKL